VIPSLLDCGVGYLFRIANTCGTDGDYCLCEDFSQRIITLNETELQAKAKACFKI
jgi:hypothetical protein